MAITSAFQADDEGSIPSTRSNQDFIMDKDVEKAMQELHEVGNQYMKAMDDIKQDREDYWNSLSKDQQLKCFCAVVERIVDGEMAGHSYRGMLYNVFGFGTEAYAQAQMAGFLTLHNDMFSAQNEREVLESFARHNGIKNPEEAVSKYYMDIL